MDDGLIFILLGAFCLAGAVFNWDWFMGSGKARFFSRLFGSRSGGRMFYGLLGIGLVIFGLLAAFDVIVLR